MSETAATAAVRQVISAWTVPGRVPAYHKAWQDRLRKEWPVLANALDALAEDPNE